METMHFVELADERGNPIWFVDTRSSGGILVASEFFATEHAALAFMATGRGQ